MGLLPGALTPTLQEQLARLGAWMPFAKAASELAFFSGVSVSTASARTHTEQVGAAWEQLQTAAVAQITQSSAAAPVGPACQLLSVDGAMVPLVDGEWAEAKTLVLGVVESSAGTDGRVAVHSGQLSYFSRLASAEQFSALALVETHRRGTETAQTVCAVNDGAEWEQRFVDLHREDAVRILDFAHAAGYVATAVEAVWADQPAVAQAQLKDTLHELKHGSAAAVVEQVREWRNVVAARADAPRTAVETLDGGLAYLEKRLPQMAYVQFQAAGYPIGSGSVESANKLVVEARLKGSGMHWARAHVNPMLALRTIVCSDRWDEAWPHIEHQLRQAACARQTARRAQRHAHRAVADGAQTGRAANVAAATLPAQPAECVTAVATPAGVAAAGLNAVGPESSAQTAHPSEPLPATTAASRPSRKPAAGHAWRRFVYGRALREPRSAAPRAKS